MQVIEHQRVRVHSALAMRDRDGERAQITNIHKGPYEPPAMNERAGASPPPSGGRARGVRVRGPRLRRVCAPSNNDEETRAGRSRVRRFGFPRWRSAPERACSRSETATGEKFAANAANLTRMPSDFVTSTRYWPASESLIRRRANFGLGCD